MSMILASLVAEVEEALHGRRESGRVVSVTDLAHESGLPPVPFIRAFKKALGMSPYGYVMALRIAHARRLIDGGPRGRLGTLTDVAHEAGYHDSADFIRHFHRHMGTTPGAYARAADRRWLSAAPERRRS